MPRDLKIALGILTVAVLIGLIRASRGLHQRIREGLAESQSTEEKARREVLAPEIKTPTDVPQEQKCTRAAGEDRVASTTVELALSADPVGGASDRLLRPHCRYPVIGTAHDPCRRRTARVLYPVRRNHNGNFSDALSSETPSGIESEQLVVDSISQTLENNVATVRRLKILIHGQEAETLAGQLDLTGFLDPESAKRSAGTCAIERSPSNESSECFRTAKIPATRQHCQTSTQIIHCKARFMCSPRFPITRPSRT